MRILHIVRHADAVSRNKGLPDFERALIKKGVKGARSVVKRLRQSGFTADAMISSPASRALETAHVFAKELSYPLGRIELQQPIYDDGSLASLLAVVHAQRADAMGVFLFGHDPSFTEFAHYLLPEFSRELPKGAVVSVGFDRGSWSEIAPGSGRLLGFDYPISKTEEARRYKELRRDISGRLIEAIHIELHKMDPRVAEKMSSYTGKAARRIAERYIELAPNHGAGTHPFGNLAEGDADEQTRSHI